MNYLVLFVFSFVFDQQQKLLATKQQKFLPQQLLLLQVGDQGIGQYLDIGYHRQSNLRILFDIGLMLSSEAHYISD